MFIEPNNKYCFFLDIPERLLPIYINTFSHLKVPRGTYLVIAVVVFFYVYCLSPLILAFDFEGRFGSVVSTMKGQKGRVILAMPKVGASLSAAHIYM